MKQHGKAWQIQKMSILYDMTLGTDLKVDPVYFSQLKDFKIDSADIRGYNATMNRIPEADRKRIKENL
jgi:hypothetical protein